MQQMQQTQQTVEQMQKITKNKSKCKKKEIPAFLHAPTSLNSFMTSKNAITIIQRKRETEKQRNAKPIKSLTLPSHLLHVNAMTNDHQLDCCERVLIAGGLPSTSMIPTGRRRQVMQLAN